MIIVSVLIGRMNPRYFGDGNMDPGPEWIPVGLLLLQHLVCILASVGVCFITPHSGLRWLGFAWIVLVLGVSYWLALLTSMAITGIWL
jgi:hypothetical protein